MYTLKLAFPFLIIAVKQYYCLTCFLLTSHVCDATFTREQCHVYVATEICFSIFILSNQVYFTRLLKRNEVGGRVFQINHDNEHINNILKNQN